MIEQTYKGLFNTLTGLVQVYSVRPTKLQFPFIEIGDPVFADVSLKNLKRNTLTLYVHTYTKDTSKLGNAILSQQVMDKLETDLAIEGYSIDLLKLSSFNIKTEEETNQDNTRVFHGVLTYQITITEEK